MKQQQSGTDKGTIKPSRFRTALLVLLVSLGALLLVWRELDRRHQDALQQNFLSQTMRLAERVRSRMSAYDQLLRGAAGLFAASGKVSRDAWHRYVEPLRLDQHYQGMQGLGFALHLQPDGLEGLIDRIRSEGFADFAIRPAGLRAEYSCIIYLEPFAGANLRALGYDMLAEPTRRMAMERARDSGDIAYSARVALPEVDPSQQAGILVFQPVYAAGVTPQGVDERRQQLQGWVYARFRMGELMRAVLNGELGDDLRLEVFDGSSDTGALLYDSGAAAADHRTLRPTSVGLALDGRWWTLRFTPLAGFGAAEPSRPWVELSAVGVISLLMCGVTWSLVNTQGQATRIASVLTASLRKGNDDLRMAASVFAETSEGIIIADGDGMIIDANGSFSELTGYPKEELIGHDAAMLQSGHDDGQLWAGMQAALVTKSHWKGQVWLRRKEGALVALQVTVTAVKDDGGNVHRYIGLCSDVNDQKRRQQQIEHLAYHDALTSLPNRTLLADRMRQALARAKRQKTMVAICYLDLDGFKPVNDLHGHKSGDMLLVRMAQRLLLSVRHQDTVARLGGDEFVLLLSDLVDPPEWQNVVHRVQQAVREPYYLSDGCVVKVSASIGVTVFPDDPSEPDMLLRHADQAMYQAKHGGRDQVVLFDPGAPPVGADRGVD